MFGRRKRMPAAEIAKGARTIEVTAVQLGHKLGVAIVPVRWRPSIPSKDVSHAENYSLKIQASLKGSDEMFDILFPREWVENSSSGAVAEEAERKTKAAIVKAKERLLE